VKFLYCKRCKDIRLKSWYAISNKCPVCLSDATPIKIPNTWLTYLLYALYVTAPALIALYAVNHDKQYLWFALILVFIMMAITWVELGRGRGYARAKVKITQQNLTDFRRRGWT
jgi:uncharacterized membrane protein YdbT with pleckstrin-like domain